jgi:hypothetical protein
VKWLRKWFLLLFGVALWLSDLTGLADSIARWETWAGQLTADEVKVLVFVVGALLVLWPAMLRPALIPEIKRRWALFTRPTLEVFCEAGEPYVEEVWRFDDRGLGPPLPDYTIYRVGVRNNGRQSIDGVRLRLAHVIGWSNEIFHVQPLFLRVAQDDDQLNKSLHGVRIDPGPLATLFELARVDDPPLIQTTPKTEPKLWFSFATKEKVWTQQEQGYRITIEASALNRRPTRARFQLVPSPRSLSMPTPAETGWDPADFKSS